MSTGINGQKLDNGSVGNVQLADGSVTSEKTAGDFDGSEFLPQPAGSVLAGPATGADAKPTFRQLTAQDLPTIDPSNLPIASTTQLGVVQVGTGLAATAGGVLGINNSVAPGTGEKITYNAQGLITGSADLVAGDIPALPADKITSGEFGTDRIADSAITAQSWLITRSPLFKRCSLQVPVWRLVHWLPVVPAADWAAPHVRRQRLAAGGLWTLVCGQPALGRHH